MIDERTTLSPALADQITATVREAADAAVRQLFANEKKAAADALVEQQKAKLNTKLPANGEIRSEVYPIKVQHAGVYSGVNTTIAMDGCSRYFFIEQQSWRPSRAQHGRKPVYNPAWTVFLVEGKNQTNVEVVEDLESAVQRCIVALLGHVWYGHR